MAQLSKNTIIGISVGGVIVLIVIGIFIYKKMHKPPPPSVYIAPPDSIGTPATAATPATPPTGAPGTSSAPAPPPPPPLTANQQMANMRSLQEQQLAAAQASMAPKK